LYDIKVKGTPPESAPKAAAPATRDVQFTF
jgi:hypothetical protein